MRYSENLFEITVVLVVTRCYEATFCTLVSHDFFVYSCSRLTNTFKPALCVLVKSSSLKITLIEIQQRNKVEFVVGIDMWDALNGV